MSTTDPPAIAAAENSRRRRWLHRLAVASVVVALLGLALTYLPAPVVRHLVDAELDRLGIAHEGVGTLQVRPWRGEAWVGPVTLRRGEVAPARVERIALAFRYRPLLERRLLVESITLDGIDLAFVRHEDGRLEVNGIDLAGLAFGEDAQPDSGSGWGIGEDLVELRDSRVVFRDRTGGTLTLDVERLALQGFRTWSPEEPGRFALSVRVNDIDLAGQGEAWPFSDTLRLSAETTVERADLAKITGFTGPLGFERRDGVLGAELRHEVAVDAQGRIEGRVVGRVGLAGADYVYPELLEMTSERVDLDVDLRYGLEPEGGVSVTGSAEGGLRAAAFDAGPALDVGLDAARLALRELSFETIPGEGYALAGRPVLQVDGARYSGALRVSVSGLLQVLTWLQSLSAGQPVSAETTGLGDWTTRGAVLPQSDLTAERLQVDAGTFRLAATGNAVSFDLASETRAEGIHLETLDGNIRAAALESRLEGLRMRSGEGALSLTASGRTMVRDADGDAPAGRARGERIEASVERFELASRTGEITLALVADAGVEGVAGEAAARDGLPASAFGVGAAAVSFADTRVRVAAGQPSWSLAGAGEAESLQLTVGDGSLGRGSVGRLVVDGVRADESLTLEANEAFVEELDVALTRDLVSHLLAVTGTDPASPVSTAPSDVAELVTAVQQRLTELGYAPGAADGKAGPKTRAAIEAFQRERGFAVDGTVTPRLLARLRTATAEGAQERAASAVPRLRANRMAIAPGARIRFSDSTVQPRVDTETVLETVEIRDLDTGDPEARTHLEATIALNELTELGVSGWVSLAAAPLAFEIEGRVANLPLPPYSPYAAELVGMYLERGQLSAEVKAATEAEGALGGLVDLRLDDVEFSPLSEADAKRLEDRAGLPVQTAVNLLQNANGRIELALPIGGTVDAPSVDLSQAIGKAIGGALQRIFPPTLIAGAIARSGEAAGVPELQPMEFEPGSSNLGPEERAYADKLLELLAERPKLRIQVCGRATAADLRALAPPIASPPREAAPSTAAAEPTPREPPSGADAAAREAVARDALENLAEARTRAVRTYMVQDKGMDAGRVGECRATADPEDDEPPRVDVTF